jgi:hypothetical protein
LRQQLRLRQGLIITAQGGTPARIIITTTTTTTTSGTTIVATSRGPEARMPGSGSRAHRPYAKAA